MDLQEANRYVFGQMKEWKTARTRRCRSRVKSSQPTCFPVHEKVIKVQYNLIIYKTTHWDVEWYGDSSDTCSSLIMKLIELLGRLLSCIKYYELILFNYFCIYHHIMQSYSNNCYIFCYFGFLFLYCYNSLLSIEPPTFLLWSGSQNPNKYMLIIIFCVTKNWCQSPARTRSVTGIVAGKLPHRADLHHLTLVGLLMEAVSRHIGLLIGTSCSSLHDNSAAAGKETCLRPPQLVMRTDSPCEKWVSGF